MAERADLKAVRATVRGRVQGVGFREATRRRALTLGLAGWVRNEPDGTVTLHAEGPEAAVGELVSYLGRGPRAAQVEEVEVGPFKFEGHEQFAIRGVSAGIFMVREFVASGDAAAPYFELWLEVSGQMRLWKVPKGPSMDPADKRLALIYGKELDLEALEGAGGGGYAIVWDRGTYEQRGRVAWPEAIDRGHAMFVLHGEKLTGGFALQRTGPAGSARWLLVKRRDEAARPDSDVTSEQPGSVISGETLEQLRTERPSA